MKQMTREEILERNEEALKVVDELISLMRKMENDEAATHFKSKKCWWFWFDRLAWLAAVVPTKISATKP